MRQYGDRIRVVTGEHAGRLGTVTDNADQIAQICDLLLESPTRQAMLANLLVTPGNHAIRLDAEDEHGTCGGRGGQMITLPIASMEDA